MNINYLNISSHEMADRYPTASQVIHPVENRLEPKRDTCVTETTISRSHVAVGVPEYSKFRISTVATGRTEIAPGQLKDPYGVAIDEATHQIFITTFDKVEVFSETGEYLYQLGVGQLVSTWGIAIHNDSVYVSCYDHTISKFSLKNMSLVRKIGGSGSNSRQSDYPSQLTTDYIGRVFITDTQNNRICVHDTNLNHLHNITGYSISQPCDVKISNDRLYVLCPDDSLCMHVLTLEGVLLHSLITCEEGMNVSFPLFFCLDPDNNLVISDIDTHSIRVFSSEGNFLHNIGREGHQRGMFYEPQGVAITPNGRLVCVSMNENYGLQIF